MFKETLCIGENKVAVAVAFDVVMIASIDDSQSYKQTSTAVLKLTYPASCEFPGDWSYAT